MPSWQADSLVPGIGAAKPGGVDWDNANNVESNAESLGISNQSWTTGFCQGTVSGATSSTPCRATPDVSAQADEFTGAVTIYSTSFVSSFSPSGWITIGGTSSATPIWAAMLALVDESSGCSSIAPSNGGTGIGFATPLLYALASDPTTYAQSFHDITVGNNDVYGFDNGNVFPAHTGYSMATGLGSPELTSPSDGVGLAADVCGLVTSASARPAVTLLSPAAGPVAAGTSVTVTGTGFKSGGVSDVSSVEVGGANVTGSAITVTSNTSLTLTMPSGAAAAAPPATRCPIRPLRAVRPSSAARPRRKTAQGRQTSW
jgi:subtilase family serine protease